MLRKLKIILLLSILVLSGCATTSPAIAATRTTYPIFKAWSSAGKPLANGFLYTYEPGTTTNKATYTDATGLTPNSNPVVMDSLGEGDVFISGDTKLVLKTSSGVTIWTEDAVADEVDNRNTAISTAISDFSSTRIFTGISLNTEYSCDLAAAIADIGSTVTTLALDCSPVMPEGSASTIPSTLTLYHNNGAIIKGTAGGVKELLAINGGMTGDMLSQWFDSSVTVSGSPKITEVYPEMFGAVGDSDGTTGSGVNDTTAIVNALLALKEFNGGNLLITKPWYRCDATLRMYANTTIKGSGGIYFDTLDFGSTPGSTGDFDNFQQAGIVAHSGVYGTFVGIREISVSTWVDNVHVKDIRIKSNGSYTSSFSVNHKGIRFHGCRNSSVNRVNITGFNAEMIYASEYGYNIQFDNNVLSEGAHNGLNFNGRIYSSSISGNVSNRVSQPIEATGWDNVIANNTFDVISRNGILLGADTLLYESSAIVTGNSIAGLSSLTHFGIVINISGASIEGNYGITDNLVSGQFSVGISAINTLPDGAVKVYGNTIIEKATAANGSCINIKSGGLVEVYDNTCIATTGNMYSAISMAATTSTCSIRNNTIVTTTALRGGASLFAGVIQYQITKPEFFIGGNIVNSSITGTPTYNIENSATPTANYIVNGLISSSTTITGLTDGSEGQKITLIGNVGSVNVDNSGNIKLTATPFIMGANDSLTLVKRGSNWIEVSRSNVF